MNKDKVVIYTVFIVITSLLFFSIKRFANAQDSQEKIVYSIEPVGRAEYNDMGLVKKNGSIVKFTTFRTQVLGFDDTEKIYTEPKTFLPLRVERDITMWMGKEYIVEEYSPDENSLVIRKFQNDKEVQKLAFKGDGPIHNAIMLPFFLRRIPELKVGWTFKARFPDEFVVKLVNLEEVEVPAGKFKTYHFTSEPNKFEIWISRDALHLPVKIKGVGGLGYTMVMQEHSVNTP